MDDQFPATCKRLVSRAAYLRMFQNRLKAFMNSPHGAGSRLSVFRRQEVVEAP